MRIRRPETGTKTSAFNVPLAGLLLSVVTFSLGTLVPTIYARLSFSGIAIQQPSDVRGIHTSIEGTSSLDSTRQRVAFSTLLKVANANKDAALLEKIEAESFDSNGTRFDFLDVDVSPIESNAQGGVSFDLPAKIPVGVATSQLPLLIKPESQQVLVVSLWYKADAAGRVDEAELSKRFSGYVEANRLKISLRLSGKQRNYELQAGPWTRYQPDRPAPGPEELARRQYEETLLQLRDSVPKENEVARRKIDDELRKLKNKAASQP